MVGCLPSFLRKSELCLPLSSPHFPQIDWVNAIYDAFLAGVRLNFSITKIRAVEAAIIIHLPSLTSEDRKRWLAIQEAIKRAYDRNVAEGVTAESVRLGIDSLERGNAGRGAVSDDEMEGQEVAARITRAGKARAVEEVDDEDEDEEENADDSASAPQEKKNAGYMPYDVERHFHWHHPVRSVSFLYRFVR
jgi:hypothetical protein